MIWFVIHREDCSSNILLHSQPVRYDRGHPRSAYLMCANANCVRECAGVSDSVYNSAWANCVRVNEKCVLNVCEC